MKTPLPVIEEHAFVDKDFVGGHVVLDFINTVTGRNGRPRDWIPNAVALADWAAASHLLPKATCARLKHRARRYPAEASRALQSARELRELLFGVLTRVMGDETPSQPDLTWLHHRWCRSVGRHVLRHVDGSIRLDRPNTATTLDAIADELVIRAVELVRALPAPRLRMCSGPNCAWLFLDTSKAGRRRWCDMAVCGNDAKAKRFYVARKQRVKQADR
jgi:predicted RNA-binding Zn ribbon-like protein